MKLRLNHILLLLAFALSANAHNLDYSASKPLFLEMTMMSAPVVWVMAVVIVLLFGVVLLQLRQANQLKKALEIAREGEEKARKSAEEARLAEEQAKHNEEVAKHNEEIAKANEEEARKREEKARADEEAARKSEEVKDIFMDNMSHSLRTPLNAIIGFSDLLMSVEEGMLPREERDNLLQLINKNGLDLLHLINELLSLSQVEGEQQLFKREVVDVDLEMSRYVSEIRPQLKEGVTIDVVEPIDGLRALADKKLMRIVTMHMLENAMQHTKEGKITLTYYLKEGGLYCEVKDTGDGLPEKLKEDIFGLLANKHTFTHDENQDNPGLGLSVCKAIIDRCNGKIGAHDNTEDGHGTIFWYWTPTEIFS